MYGTHLNSNKYVYTCSQMKSWQTILTFYILNIMIRKSLKQINYLKRYIY